MFRFDKPGLLVSVRNAEEALAALEGGADVIDVKEPYRGPLGAADARTISQIAEVVDGRAPVTAALGELVDLTDIESHLGAHATCDRISLFKIGLSQCHEIRDWRARWSAAIDQMLMRFVHARPVAVVYADWRAAKAPRPSEVLEVAIELSCPALLIDTWNKAGGSLFRLWPADDLRTVLANARSHRIAAVLAGSLTADDFPAAAELRPDLIAVRGAACVGGREGAVSANLVRRLKLKLAAHSQTAPIN